MKFPKIVFAPELLNEKDKAGVVVAVATLVVNSGDNVPDENEVTVPDPELNVGKNVVVNGLYHTNCNFPTAAACNAALISVDGPVTDWFTVIEPMLPTSFAVTAHTLGLGTIFKLSGNVVVNEPK